MKLNGSRRRRAWMAAPMRWRSRSSMPRERSATRKASQKLTVRLSTAVTGMAAAHHQKAGIDSACRPRPPSAAASVSDHLEAYGVSVDIVYEVDQLRARTRRIELLLDALLAPQPQPELLRLLRELVRVAGQQRGIRAVMARHYSLLARRVAERHAETGSHYITRDRAEYLGMLRMALGGGAIIAGTTFVKFAVVAIGLSAFWTGFWAGANYAVSFLVVMLLHWTVATKQPAMTAPALAASLPAARRQVSSRARR